MEFIKIMIFYMFLFRKSLILISLPLLNFICIIILFIESSNFLTW